MRAYLVQGPGGRRYAGSMADARAKRDELVEKLGCRKKDVDIEEVDIETGKGPVLDFINALCAEADRPV